VNDLNAWGLDHATEEHRLSQAEQLVDAVLNRVRHQLIDAVADFFKQPLSPLAVMTFEMALLGLVRELGRQLFEGVLNACEPSQSGELPKDLWFECADAIRKRPTETSRRGLVISSCIGMGIESGR